MFVRLLFNLLTKDFQAAFVCGRPASAQPQAHCERIFTLQFRVRALTIDRRIKNIYIIVIVVQLPSLTRDLATQLMSNYNLNECGILYEMPFEINSHSM